jgi:hypothetical protein
VLKLIHEKIENYRILFLYLPVELEDVLMDFICCNKSYEELIDEALEKCIMPEPLGSWEYNLKPILEYLPKLYSNFQGVRILCYGSSENEFASMNVSSKLTRLTLRTSLTGTIDADEWRSTVIDSLIIDKDARESEFRNLASKAEGDAICLSDMGGSRLKGPLRDNGFEVLIRYVEKPYHYNPLMILKRKMAIEPIGDNEIKRLVRCHLDYIKKYIYRFENRDRAHYEWVWDNFLWMRKKIKKEELFILKSILDAT